MSDEGRTARSSGHQIVEHYCEFDGCNEWGCYGFEESRTVTRWFCSEHQPRLHRGLLWHGEARLAAAEIADMIT